MFRFKINQALIRSKSKGFMVEQIITISILKIRKLSLNLQNQLFLIHITSPNKQSNQNR